MARLIPTWARPRWSAVATRGNARITASRSNPGSLTRTRTKKGPLRSPTVLIVAPGIAPATSAGGEVIAPSVHAEPVRSRLFPKQDVAEQGDHVT